MILDVVGCAAFPALHSACFKAFPVSISLKLAFNLIKYNNPLHGIAASSLHKPKPVSRQKTGPALWPVKIF